MLSESEKKGKTRKVLARISSSKIPVISNFTPKWNVQVNNLFQEPLTASLKSFVLKSFI